MVPFPLKSHVVVFDPHTVIWWGMPDCHRLASISPIVPPPNAEKYEA